MQSAVKSLPVKIKNYDLIRIGIPKYINNESQLELLLMYEEVGSLNEVLVTYDNEIYRYTLRASGRGRDMHLKAEKQLIIYDSTSPITMKTLVSKTYPLQELDNSIARFLEWLKRSEGVKSA